MICNLMEGSMTKGEFQAWYSKQRAAAKEIEPDATYKVDSADVIFRAGFGSQIKNGLSRFADDFAPCPDREWHNEFNRNIARMAYTIKTGARRRKICDSLEYMRRCREAARCPVA